MEGALPSFVFCSSCKLPLRDVVSTTCCASTFCRACVGQKCVKCDVQIGGRVHANPALQSIVDDLVFWCPNTLCNTWVPAALRDKHLDDCSFELVMCPLPADACGKVVTRKVLPEHLHAHVAKRQAKPAPRRRLACTYARYGCRFTAVDRSALAEHDQAATASHLAMVTRAADAAATSPKIHSSSDLVFQHAWRAWPLAAAPLAVCCPLVSVLVALVLASVYLLPVAEAAIELVRAPAKRRAALQRAYLRRLRSIPAFAVAYPVLKKQAPLRALWFRGVPFAATLPARLSSGMRCAFNATSLTARRNALIACLVTLFLTRSALLHVFLWLTFTLITVSVRPAGNPALHGLSIVLLWFVLAHPGASILLLTQERILRRITPCTIRGAVAQLIKLVR